jgi:hypothetical protein
MTSDTEYRFQTEIGMQLLLGSVKGYDDNAVTPALYNSV